MGKSSGDASTVTQVQPWTSQQPYLERAFGEALGLFEQPREYFGGPTYTPFSAQTETGIQALGERAGQPNVLGQYLPGALAAGQTGLGTLEQAARGDFMGQNPYLRQQFDLAAEAMVPSINATFGAGGRTGSGAHAMSLGRGLADLGTRLYGGAYESERGRQQQAAQVLGGLGTQAGQLAPTAQAMDLQNIQSLLRAGQLTEAKANEILQSQIARHQFQQDEPTRRLGEFMNLIQGQYGQQGQKTQEIPRNPLAGAIGGALAGSQLGTSPWWGIGGGILGGLLG